MAAYYELGGDKFSTKKAVTSRLRYILNKAADVPNDRVRYHPLSEKDQHILRDLLKHHPRWTWEDSYPNAPVAYCVLPNGRRGFGLVRWNGSVSPFSCKVCIDYLDKDFTPTEE